MAQLCLHYSGGGGGGNTTFGGFVFGTSGNVIKAKSAPSPQSPVKIIYSATQTYGEISGKVQQLFKDKPHHGKDDKPKSLITNKLFDNEQQVVAIIWRLSIFTRKFGCMPNFLWIEFTLIFDLFTPGLLIELYGTVQLGSDPELQLTLTSSQSQALATCVLAQGASPEVPITTKAYQKFPFVLRFPPNFPLPPSFASQGGKVNYKVVVSMRVHKKLKLLHELPLHYVGDHKISELSSIGALKHLVLDVEASPATPRVCTLEKGNCTTTLTMEKSEFMINEDLPFKFEVKFGSEGTSGTSIKLKLITITLLRRIRTSAKGRRDQESTEILEVVTFKRFLNRGQISRSGSLKLGSIPGLTTTFGGHYGKVRLGIEYGIGVRFGREGQRSK